MSTTGAWLLEFGGGHAGLIGERQMLHLLPAPLSLHEVPASPVFCRHVVMWEQQPIPVMDLCAWLEGRRSGDDPPVVAIAAFANGTNGENRRGGLMLSAIPRRVALSDEQACDLPVTPTGWRELALSCVQYETRPVPIVNLARAFSGTLSQAAATLSIAETHPMEARAEVLTP